MQEEYAGPVLHNPALEFHPGYILTELLGKGGQASVYRVHDPADHADRPRAVKLFNPDLEKKEQQLFEAEAQRAVSLRHPNILATYNFGIGTLRTGDREQPGYPFMLMEYAAGGSYAQRLKELSKTGHVLPMEETITVIGQLAAGITHAYQSERIVHRDIKPANILRKTRSLETPHVLVGDFGIASTLHTMMSTQPAMGSLQYMAPEQCDTRQKPEHRTDTYATAITAYQFLTGQFPFEADTPINYMYAHLEGAPRPFNDLQDIEITGTLLSLEAIILQGLAKNPKNRPTIDDFSLRFREAYEQARAREQALSPTTIDVGPSPRKPAQSEPVTQTDPGKKYGPIPPKPKQPPASVTHANKAPLRERWTRQRLIRSGLVAATMLGIPAIGGLAVEMLDSSLDDIPRPSASSSEASWEPSAPASPSSSYPATPTYSASPEPQPGSSPSGGGVTFPWIGPSNGS